MKVLCGQYVSESSKGSLNPVQQPTKRSNCLLTRNNQKGHRLKRISGASSQD